MGSPMITRDELIEFLLKPGGSDSYLYNEGTDIEGKSGIYLLNTGYFSPDEQKGTLFIAYNDLHKLSLEQIKMASHAGRCVDHFTRVTGFMSKVSAWNQGKIGELKDRYRSGIGGDFDGTKFD